MGRVRFDPARASHEVIRKAAAVIQEGGIVLYPSDTVYGLGCDPFNEKAVEKLFKIKGRPGRKGVLLLIPDLSWIKVISRNTPKVFYELVEKVWPGPITVLLKGRAGLPSLILGERGQVGLRCPDSPYLRSWMNALPGPLVSTSANLSGQTPARTVKDLRRLFDDRVDLFLDGGDLPTNIQPSTVVDLTTRPALIIRSGRQADRVQQILHSYGKGHR